MKILCTNGVKAVTAELVPAIQRDKGLAAEVVYGSTALLLDKIKRGETGDLAILSAEAIDGLIAQDTLVGGSRVDLAKSGIGVAVRRGTVAPDISTPEALAAALKAAKAVAYSRTGISGQYMPDLFKKLGIADEIAPKAVIPSAGTVGDAVAHGDADIGLQQISELLPIGGIKVAGPLPAAVQLITVFSAGVFTTAEEPRAARMMMQELTANATREVYAAKGLEPAF
jgi:molybdate transport system substrate-binding protein